MLYKMLYNILDNILYKKNLQKTSYGRNKDSGT